MANTDEVFTTFLTPMTRLWSPPYRCKDESDTLGEYARFLGDFDQSDLDDGLKSLVKNRGDAAKYWPSISECMAACTKARARSYEDAGESSGNKYSHDFEDEARRQKLANDLLLTDQAREWIRESIAEFVWLHFYETEDIPNIIELAEFRDKHAEWEVWVREFAGESHAAERKVEAFRTMRDQRTEHALSGRPYRPIEGEGVGVPVR